MSALKSAPKRSKRGAKKLAVWCDLQDGHAHLAYRAEMMKPAQALQNMRDVVMEMRALMGLGKIHTPVGEPQWLTDAVEAERTRVLGVRRRMNVVDVDGE